MGGERGGERRDEGVVLERWRWWDYVVVVWGVGAMEVVGPLRTSRPRIAIDPPSFRGLGGFCCLPDRLVSCRRLLGPKIEKRHLRLAARSGGVGNTLTTGSVPRCASLKLFWMSSKVPAPGRAAGGGGARLLNAPPIAAARRVGVAPRTQRSLRWGKTGTI